MIATLDLYWVLQLLNDALACDARAITCLIENRVICNETLSNHDSIQVLEEDGIYTVGILGILNGLCGTDEETGYGPITAIYDDKDEFIIRFEKTDFERIKRWQEMN